MGGWRRSRGLRGAIKSAATRRVGARPNGFRISLSNSSNSKSPARPRAFRRAPLIFLLGPPNSAKIDPKIDQNFDVILVSFLVPLGSLLASLLDPLGRPNRPKFGPRGPKTPQDGLKTGQDDLFYAESRFFKNSENPKEIQWFWLPQPAQDCPKMALSPVKMAQDRPKTTPRRSQDDLEGYFFALENRVRF